MVSTAYQQPLYLLANPHGSRGRASENEVECKRANASKQGRYHDDEDGRASGGEVSTPFSEGKGEGEGEGEGASGSGSIKASATARARAGAA